MKLYHKNPRTISKKQYSQLEEWLRELGDLSGIVHDLNTDEIIGGNQRSRVFDVDKCKVEITQQLDAPDEQGTVALGFIVWEGKRYSYRQVRWTDKQCEKANVVANKAGGDWEWDTLANNFDMGDLLEWGFSEKELTGCDFGPAGEADAEPQIDKAAILQEQWQTCMGQLWTIGSHRLLIGDSTKREDVERLMAGEKVGAVVTDPPYGMNLDIAYAKMHHGKDVYTVNRFEPVVGDNKPFDPIPLLTMFEECPEIALFGGDYYAQRLPEGGGWFCWDKRWNDAGMDLDKVRGSAFELIWSKRPHKREIARILWSGHHGMATDDLQMRMHPTQKPALVLKWLLERIAGDPVLDPFCGSGTTMVACENLGRRCMAIEISPNYVAVILQRMQDAFDITGELDIALQRAT